MTLDDKMKTPGGFTTGFDYLRILLSIGVLVFHSVALATGSDAAVWTGPYRFFPATILPMFFALSGFLVTGSLQRVKLHQFVTLRLIRLLPALAVEITLSTLIIGVLVTTLPFSAYIDNPMTWKYFLNIVGYIHYWLPGVFDSNIYPKVMNGQLWTIPFEFECYFSLIVLSLISLVKRRRLFVFAVFGFCLLATIYTFLTHRGIVLDNHVPGRMLVASFLAAVAIYLYKDNLPLSHLGGVLSLLVAVILLQYLELCYLAPFPVAYATVWIGLMRLPPIPFGDLSYGVFLFHFPVEQTLMHVFPGIQDWWLLTLITLPLTAVFAWMSWTFVEHPILRRKKQILALSDRVIGSIAVRSPYRLGR